MPELGCTRIVEDRERDNNGKWIIFHRLCGRPCARPSSAAELIPCPFHDAFPSFKGLRSRYHKSLPLCDLQHSRPPWD